MGGGLGNVSLTGTVSADAIVGSLSGSVGIPNFTDDYWTFNGTTVTLRRGTWETVNRFQDFVLWMVVYEYLWIGYHTVRGCISRSPDG